MTGKSPKPRSLPDTAHDEALDAALRILDSIGISRGKTYIGSGTALVMRWEHRRPTGIWLFVEAPVWRESLRDFTIAEAGARARANGAESLLQGFMWMRWQTAGIHAGVFASTPLKITRAPPRISEETEARTGIPLESTWAALRKKINGRMLVVGGLVPRDAIDIEEAARREPEELQEVLSRYIGKRSRATLAQELRWQAHLDPDEELKGLWSGIERILRAADIPRPPNRPIPQKKLTPQMGRHTTEMSPTRVKLLSDQGFRQHPAFLKRQPFQPCRFELHRSLCMAGHPLSPSGEEIRDWLLAEKPEDLPGNAITYLSEYLKQLNGENLADLRQNSGASLRDIAKVARWAGPMMSPMLKAGLNRWVRLLSGDRTEETEGMSQLQSLESPA